MGQGPRLAVSRVGWWIRGSGFDSSYPYELFHKNRQSTIVWKKLKNLNVLLGVMTSFNLGRKESNAFWCIVMSSSHLRFCIFNCSSRLKLIVGWFQRADVRDQNKLRQIEFFMFVCNRKRSNDLLMKLFPFRCPWYESWHLHFSWLVPLYLKMNHLILQEANLGKVLVHPKLPSPFDYWAQNQA